MASEQSSSAKPLKLRSIIGFSGSVPEGFLLHPGKKHRIYPLGSNIIIQDVKDGSGGRQEFLQGHNNVITCIATNRSGSMIASGQITHMGFQADIILWDFQSRLAIRHLVLHKVKVEALAFSPNGKFLASLGGEDDNSVIVWDVAQGTAICGAPASRDTSGAATCLKFFSNSDLHFVTGGAYNLRMWEINETTRKVKPTDFQMGTIKRKVQCIAIDLADEFLYCGTSSGDLLKVSLKSNLFKLSGPPKEKDNFSLGVITCVLPESTGIAYVGAGDGSIAEIDRASLRVLRRTRVDGQVTSIFEHAPGRLIASTKLANIYSIDLSSKEMHAERLIAWHHAPVNDVAFPEASSKVFATATDADIRVWGAESAQEYLRIQLPNVEAKCIIFRKDGRALLSGWSDGKIRAFGPQSGRLQYVIHDAHRRCVTALAVTDMDADGESYRVVSGGDDGQVRVWRTTRTSQVLETAMKEHKGMVTCIKVRANNMECVSSSADGSCIVWDLERHVRNQVLFAPSFFKAVTYCPEEFQLLTCGTDRKVAYWEAYDGSLIREIETNQGDSINSLDITRDGNHFVIGGTGKMLRVYRYNEGDLSHYGMGHSTEIQKVKIAPDQSYIVSVSTDGAVFQWVWNEKEAAEQKS